MTLMIEGGTEQPTGKVTVLAEHMNIPEE